MTKDKEKKTKKADKYLGKLGRDKVTGFEGIVVCRIKYLFGCDHLGLAPKANKEGNKTESTEYFDKGRVEILAEGIPATEVQVKKPGGINRDAPRS